MGNDLDRRSLPDSVSWDVFRPVPRYLQIHYEKRDQGKEMITHGIELPPLPEASKMYDIPGYDEEELKAYARAAVEADRKRRGEPVGYVSPSAIKRLKAGRNAIVGGMSQGFDVPLYAAPQPAEPVGEVLGETCIDGGKCHHGCKERCFRRQCCEPFSDYSGPWEYAAETDSPQPSEPAKSYLKVSYDKYGDCLYVVCDSNEPARSDEDEKGVLYRYAESDGRLVGITILDFMGRHAESSDNAPQPAEPDKQHPDDVAVDAFAAAMKAKLKRAREEKGRGGWQDMSATELSAMLREHVEKGDPVDVANLAMMLHQNGQGITPAEPVKSTCKKCNGTGVESTRFHGVWPNGEECLEPIKCDQCDGFGTASAAEPVKVPSDEVDLEEVRRYLDAWGCLDHPGVRALLARYGKGAP